MKEKINNFEARFKVRFDTRDILDPTNFREDREEIFLNSDGWINKNFESILVRIQWREGNTCMNTNLNHDSKVNPTILPSWNKRF